MNYRIGPTGLLLFLVVACTLICLTSGDVHAQGSGRISVTVTNRTAGEALAGHAVRVLRHTNETGETDEMATGTTDASGQFEFEDLPLDGAHYVVSTRFSDVDYTTDHLVLIPIQATFDTSIDVFETGNSDELISVGALHVIVEANPDVLNITEIVIVRNNGGSTFVPETQDAAIALTLPSTAFGLQPVTPGVENTDHGLRYTSPIPPGETQIFYTYSLDRNAIDDELTRQMEYDTERVQVFVLPSTQTVTASNLTNDGVRQIGDKNYMTLSNTVGLKRGMSIRLELPSELIWQDIMKWGVFGMAVLMAIVGIIAIAKSDPADDVQTTSSEKVVRSPEETERAELEFDKLVYAIADLDEEYETGDLEEKAYRRRRKNLKRRAARVHSVSE
ncbi:MAG: hypothetical protein HOH43_22180 [Candidatus Latescibacteria bacterium]|nr:hypothetical protein [Candidatus Latescibacterota bacterium]